MTGLELQARVVESLQPVRVTGRVHALRGLCVLVSNLPVPTGSLVRIRRSSGGCGRGPSGDAEPTAALGEVIGFDGEYAIVMMLASAIGIRAGDPVVALQAAQTIGVGRGLLGRVINGLGVPIDGGPPLHGLMPRPLDPEPIPPLSRRRIERALFTGVRAIDLMTTMGQGQRMGIFAGPGVGKSTLLGSAARNTSADISVVALIGERGREVREFIEQSLGCDGLRRSVIVVATGDEPALLRVRAAMAACAVAEHFRDAGQNVLLIMDSVTRFAHAQRQIGLSVGEPPATRGYTPSVFAALARLLERAGPVEPSGGSVTGLYSILVEGDDMSEPVADATRGMLDGHIVLSRSLAQRGHFPAIDVLDSVSRVADVVSDPAHIAARRQVVRLLAAYRQVEDLVQVGAYAKGSNPVADVALRYYENINALLRQEPGEREEFESARSRLVRLAIEAGSAVQSQGAVKKA